MLYIDDFSKVQNKFMEFWAKENHDRPILSIHAPKKDYKYKNIKVPDTLLGKWTDVEYIIQRTRQNLESTHYAGEAFPFYMPNYGPDIVGAILGCDIQFGEHTSWAVHTVEDFNNYKVPPIDDNNLWWKKIKDLTQAITEDAKGDYLVGVADLHAGLDALVSLRGPQELCMDMVDDPEPIKKICINVYYALEKIYNGLFDITQSGKYGSTTWMGCWHPKKFYPTSCDLICMISPQMFDEFVLEELLMEVNFFDATLFHLDGPGALKHLDKLLSIPKLDGIQWVYGDGAPPAVHWIDVCKKIQDAGKCLQIDISASELPVMLENLKPEGVKYNLWAPSPEEAENLIKMALSSRKKTIF